MIKYIEGDLFTSKCKCLVNTVNCVGVMGKGIALQFKNKYPHMFTLYKSACNKGLLKNGGDIWIYDLTEFLPFKDITTNCPKILCFATKEDWRNPSKIEWLEKGLKTFVEHYKDWKIDSIAFPKLGCNNGGLNWEIQVKPLMEKYLNDLDIYIEIYV